MIFVYFLIVIWGKDKQKGENVLMLPILRKINLFKAPNYDKELLLKTMLPTLISSILCPIIALMLSGYDVYEWKLILMSLPLFFLIISLIYLYSNEWLNTDN